MMMTVVIIIILLMKVVIIDEKYGRSRQHSYPELMVVGRAGGVVMAAARIG